MAMGTRKHRQRQEQLWVTHTELATGPGHPFYTRLNELLDKEKFDEFAEEQCAQFYCENKTLITNHHTVTKTDQYLKWGMVLRAPLLLGPQPNPDERETSNGADVN
jgi:hypothetical protein